jgi:hypothetical protein
MVSLEAEILFKVLFRFVTYKHGRPIYPEPVTWGLIEQYLEEDKRTFMDDRRYRVEFYEVRAVTEAIKAKLTQMIEEEKDLYASGGEDRPTLLPVLATQKEEP